jgi:hypothetical protein
MRAIILLFVAASALAQKTDLNPYAVPAPPALPAAGGKFTDAVFGTTIMRVTDTNDGAGCYNDYSYWQAFSSDMTRFIVRCGGNGNFFVYSFDASGFTAAKGADLGEWRSLFFSQTEPKILWGLGYSPYDNDLVRVDVTNINSPSITTVKDFSSLGVSTWQLFADDAGDRFSFKSATGTNVYAWDRSSDAMLLNKSYANLDEAQIDRSGRWVVVKSTTENWIVDLDNSNTETYLASRLDPHYSFGHSDNGSGFAAAGMNDYDEHRGVIKRTFTAISSLATHIWNPGSDWYLNDWHVSQRMTGDLWTGVSNYRIEAGACGYATAGSAGQAALRNEIFLAKSDGSGQFQRVAHHQSCYCEGGNYWATPRAVFSPDGAYVMWSSTWSRSCSGRTDVYLAATGLTSTPPVDPPSGAAAARLSGAAAIRGAAGIR